MQGKWIGLSFGMLIFFACEGTTNSESTLSSSSQSQDQSESSSQQVSSSSLTILDMSSELQTQSSSSTQIRNEAFSQADFFQILPIAPCFAVLNEDFSLHDAFGDAFAQVFAGDSFLMEAKPGAWGGDSLTLHYVMQSGTMTLKAPLFNTNNDSLFSYTCDLSNSSRILTTFNEVCVFEGNTYEVERCRLPAGTEFSGEMIGYRQEGWGFADPYLTKYFMGSPVGVDCETATYYRAWEVEEGDIIYNHEPIQFYISAGE